MKILGTKSFNTLEEFYVIYARYMTYKNQFHIIFHNIVYGKYNPCDYLMVHKNYNIATKNELSFFIKEWDLDKNSKKVFLTRKTDNNNGYLCGWKKYQKKFTFLVVANNQIAEFLFIFPFFLRITLLLFHFLHIFLFISSLFPPKR